MKLDENVKTLTMIIDALSEFKGNYHKKFNFSKLVRILSVDASNIEDLIQLILRIQDLMHNVFKNHKLKKKNENGTIYFLAEKFNDIKEEKNKENTQIIQLQKDQIQLINDLIYTFKHIEKGKGFNLNNPNTEFLNKVKRLYYKHPFLFKKNGQELFYPTKICMKLGDMIYSYNIGNKKLNQTSIDNYRFRFGLND